MANGYDEDKKSYAVSAVNTFRNTIRTGDLIIVSDGNSKFRAIGEVTGDYQLLNTTERSVYRQCRSTRWLRVYEPSRPVGELFNKSLSQMSLYELKNHILKREVLLQLLSTETNEQHKPYVMVIDEINRGNISRIFGELITLLEPTKRAGATETLTVTLPYSKEPFCVPDNLYVIGTMNTADRSLAQLDIALRRRFEFVEMMPDCNLPSTVEIEGIPVADLLQAINERIEVLLDRDHTLGHSYFLPLAREGGNTFDHLARIFEKQIIPLLQEYFFEDWQRIQWVLNDHQKPEQYQFVRQGGVTDLVSLFGNDVSSQITDRRWFINHHAFTLKESYLHPIPVRDMGTAELKLLKYPLPEWIYARFLQELERLYKRGVRFTYQTIEEESRFLRGQLNTSLQLRQPPGREHRFQIHHEIFTANRPENRLLKRALEYTRNQVRQADNWRLANELSHLLEPISASDDVKGDFQRWNDNRLMVAYRDIKPWCELILYQLSPITQKGSHEGNSLLFPMEKLFENYVEFCLRNSVKPGWHLQSQAASQYLCRHQPEQTGWTRNMFLMKPDFVLSCGSLLQMLDTKWKLLNTQNINDKYGLKQSDFYQMFAYGQKYLKGNGELMLIYPVTDDFTAPLPVFDFDDNLRLWVVPFDLHTDRLVEGNYTDYFPSLFLSQTFGPAAI